MTASGSPENFRPVFIVGAERSGTTLLAVMLDRHSGLAITAETHFFMRIIGRPGGSGPAGVSTHEQFVELLFTVERMKDLALDREKLLARFRAGPATAPALLRCVLEEYGELHGKSRVGEKTPFHIWYVPQIFRWFPEARVIGIVRDGRDVIRSVLAAPWTKDHRLRPHCLIWSHAVRAARRFAAEYPQRFRMVRYEELLLSPEKTLRELDAFLDVCFEPAQLAELQAAHTDVVPTWENDWKGKALKPPDPSRIGDWKKHVTPEERLVMNGMMKIELLRMGYDDTETPGVSALRRMREGLLNLLCKARLYRLWDKAMGRKQG